MQVIGLIAVFYGAYQVGKGVFWLAFLLGQGNDEAVLFAGMALVGILIGGLGALACRRDHRTTGKAGDWRRPVGIAAALGFALGGLPTLLYTVPALLR